tara:strand:- start:146537 stop:146761 length:225 start_codon:yes stop_codon:yes gene_type:complete
LRESLAFGELSDFEHALKDFSFAQFATRLVSQFLRTGKRRNGVSISFRHRLLLNSAFDDEGKATLCRDQEMIRG